MPTAAVTTPSQQGAQDNADTTGGQEADEAPEKHHNTPPEQSVDEVEQPDQGADEAHQEPKDDKTPPHESAEEADRQLREEEADQAQAQQQ
jgi:hypothetical protein